MVPDRRVARRRHVGAMVDPTAHARGTKRAATPSGCMRAARPGWKLQGTEPGSLTVLGRSTARESW